MEDVKILKANIKDLNKDIQELQKSLDGLTVGSGEYEDAVASLIRMNLEYANSVAKMKGNNEIAEGSYKALQSELKALKDAWKTVTDEMVREDLGARVSSVNSQLKELDKSIGDTFRNVGNYAEAADGAAEKLADAIEGVADENTIRSINELKTELRELQDRMEDATTIAERDDATKGIRDIRAQLKQLYADAGQYRAVGVTVTQDLGELEDAMHQYIREGGSAMDEQFKKMVKSAAEMQKSIDTVSAAIERAQNPIQGVTDSLSVMNSTMGLMGAYEGVMAAFGVESEAVAQSIQKLNGLMLVLNSLQAINEELMNKSSKSYQIMDAVLKWVSKDTKAVATASAAGTQAVAGLSVGTKALNISLKAVRATLASLGIPILIGLLVALVTNIDKVWNIVKNLSQGVPVLGSGVKMLGKAFEFLGEKLKVVSEWFGKISQDQDKVQFEAQLKFYEDMAKRQEEMLKNYESEGKSKEFLIEKEREYTRKLQEQLDVMSKMKGADEEKVKELQAELDERKRNLEQEKLNYQISSKRAADEKKAADDKKKRDKESTDAAKEAEAARKREFEQLKALSNEYLSMSKTEQEQFGKTTELMKANGADAETVYTREIALLQMRKQSLADTADMLALQVEKLGDDAEAVAIINEQLDKVGKEMDGIDFDIDLKISNVGVELSDKAKEEAGKQIDSLLSEYDRRLEKGLMSIDITKMFAENLEGKERYNALKKALDDEYQLQLGHYNRLELLAKDEEEKKDIRHQKDLLTMDYNAKSEELSINRQEELKEKALKTANAVSQAVQSLGSLMGTVSGIMEEEINRKLESGEISEEQAKNEFERVKKLQLSEVWINTLAGAAGAYMQAISSLGPWLGIPVGTANFAAAMATGIAQHRQIKATEFGGGGSGSSVGGLQMMAVAPIVDKTQAQNELTTLNIQGGQDKDIRVYILEADIEESLTKAQVRDTETSFP